MDEERAQPHPLFVIPLQWPTDNSLKTELMPPHKLGGTNPVQHYLQALLLQRSFPLAVKIKIAVMGLETH